MRTQIIAFFAAAFMFLGATGAHAAPTNAAPFGMEVGVATLKQVKEEIGATSGLVEVGINKFTEGPMYKTDGAGIDVEGVNSVLFIFDTKQVLAGVIVEMPKDPSGVYKTLSSKYKVISNKIDKFMNNGYAQLRKGGSIIEISAPHMSFSMEVRYVTDALMKSFNQTTQTEKAETQRKKANAL